MLANIRRSVRTLSSLSASSACAWRGTQAHPATDRPVQLLELYEMEGCPYCRIVREAITRLDLEVKILPCPKGGERFRPIVEAQGGKLQFPFLVDRNQNVKLYESYDIVAYLMQTYGKREAPSKWMTTCVYKPSSLLASACRMGRGYKVRPSKPVAEPLELYSFESSPYARPVRELLCELEIPYVLHSVGKNTWHDYVLPGLRRRLMPQHAFKGKSRRAFAQRAGEVRVPFLIDPNHSVEMFESQAMIEYLMKIYAA